MKTCAMCGNDIYGEEVRTICAACELMIEFYQLQLETEEAN